MLTPQKNPRYAVIKDAEIGEGTRVFDQVNLFKCKVGKNSKIDSYVYIEEGVVIGDNCKIRPFVFIPTGVIIEDNVFIGPNVSFTNDKYPRATRRMDTSINKGKEGCINRCKQRHSAWSHHRRKCDSWSWFSSNKKRSE